MVSSL